MYNCSVHFTKLDTFYIKPTIKVDIININIVFPRYNTLLRDKKGKLNMYILSFCFYSEVWKYSSGVRPEDLEPKDFDNYNLGKIFL
ncbi:hypothetical protein SAMN05421594_3622 [Chryseobacterium oleae]|uniref:Uncharacterized protein n=1 Tax=Chryseobacterium oleae TaxID=491207 RepID=A0A1I5AQ91_CHROL|nr:hypothetical protein SAMN05421594_3622 [Chryseobacterium oleae]